MDESGSVSDAEIHVFSNWAAQQPHLYVRVLHAVQVYQRTCESTALHDLVACRDAYQQLVAAAQEGRFPRLVSFFYQGYVQCCQALLYYVNL